MKTIVEDEIVEVGDSILMHLKEAFQTCTTRQARLSVLMLVCDLFDCTFYEVEKARSVCKRYGICDSQPKEKKVYSRLSFEKGQHFIDFLFSSGLLQETAYGTTNLKLDSGEKLTVSKTILNGINEHAIKEYIIHCKELNYDTLSCTTLRKMLNKMKPHTRKKLAGVDSFVVEGVEAFEALRKGVKLLTSNDGNKELLKWINSSEGYLKARFKAHCSLDDSCSSHCIKHAFSHPNDEDLSSTCDKIHTSICTECLRLIDCIKLLKMKVSELPSSHRRDVAVYEITNAQQKIMDWQKHIVRVVQQSKARSDIFKYPNLVTALWIRDFAQKYLPTKTLEAMNEYFGKRGMSISVEVFIFKAFGTYFKQVYLVALDRCEQNSLETLCIAQIVLQQFKKDFPQIVSLELKTDNAGNYHANGIPEAMYRMAQKEGLNISAYNYNEAQDGKDQCDRETAILKNYAEQWLLTSETNQISNAKELVDAVFANGVPKNTKMCVIKINKALATLTNVRNITNISYYHSIEFQTGGALYREYYGIGKGKFHKYNDTSFVNGASFVTNWTSSNRKDEPMSYESRKHTAVFYCPSPLCLSQFKDENELNHHLESNEHKYATAKSAMDTTILYYANQKHINNLSSDVAHPNDMDIDDGLTDNDFAKIYVKGWARKVRSVKKITPKQKEFFEKLFRRGAEHNTKLSAEQMYEEMKNELLDGDYYFSPAEYLEISRIRSLIARLKKKESAKLPTTATIFSEDDGVQQYLEDICESVMNSDDEPDFLGFDSDENVKLDFLGFDTDEI